jgi:hypothetical protein
MAMTDAEILYRQTLADLRKVYGRTILDVAKRGDNVPEDIWTELGTKFESALKMTDVIAASNIHWRATHVQTAIPSAKSTINDIMLENAWLNAHSMRTHPYIEDLAKRVSLIEKDYYLQRWEQGKLESPLDLRKQPLWRLEMFYRTTMGDVHATSQQVQLSDPAIGLRFPFAEYRSRDDGVARPTHKAMHKFLAHRSWEGWPRARPKNGFNCVLPGTYVSGSYTGGAKAWYDGPAVELHTASGNRVSVTVNHPVLTDHGFVPAGHLKEGDQLLGHHIEVNSPRSTDIDHDQAPSLIEDVFDTLRSDRATTPIPVSQLGPLDLYGESQFLMGDIDVVGAHRELCLDIPPSLDQSIIDRRFIFTHASQALMVRLRRLYASLKRSFAATGRIPSFATLALHHLTVALHGGPLQPLGFAPTPDLQVMFPDQRIDRSAWDAELFGDHIDGHAAPVHLDRPLRVGDCTTTWPGRNASHLAFDLDAALADTQFPRNLIHRNSGKVHLDSLVFRRLFDYSGHVYDLQSERGGCIIANDIYVSNCRCLLRFYAVFEAKLKGWLNADGSPKFIVRWPNAASRANWNDGSFPDKGWHGPKFVASALPFGAVA